MGNEIIVKIVNSLEKVFPMCEPSERVRAEKETVMLNEKYSFQAAYIAKSGKQNFCIETECEGCSIKLYSVGLVPSELPAYPKRDDGYIKTEPGLYPDVLRPIEEGELIFVQPEFWRSVWVECAPAKAGLCSVLLRFIAEDGNTIAECKNSFEAIGCELPEQELIHTEWLHCDCISNYYKVPMMSEAHWSLIEKYVKFASQCGINMMLTPIFTPPLDTKVGGERPTMQLVDIVLEDGQYQFGFDKLKRWIDMCAKRGIKYFEMSHLFTQWGAKHSPKIMAKVKGEDKKIFGWETDALSLEYLEFLDAFLPKLVNKLMEWEISERCFFHISDEPKMEDLENYRKAKAVVGNHLEGFKIIDALSNIEFHENGLVENPVCATDHIKPFIKSGVQNLWAYYCCAQNIGVSNRFMAMPSCRNRIIGFQMYKYDIAGFLHWGYNFWNLQYSAESINPYEVTDAGCAFPSGDSFLVYPGENGPFSSIRMKVFEQALYDLRALKLLESMTSKEYVLDILECDLIEPLNFDKYPQGNEYLLTSRSKINIAIKSMKEEI